MWPLELGVHDPQHAWSATIPIHSQFMREGSGPSCGEPKYEKKRSVYQTWMKTRTVTPKVRLNLPRGQIPFSSIGQDGDNFLIGSKIFGDLNGAYHVGAGAYAHQQPFFLR